VHAGPNPKYFGIGRGVTWYNLLSDQFSGLNAITVPGTLRDSLILLAVVLEQQTNLQPTQIMTDTGAYSDVVFGLFRLLGYRFSPRLAGIGSVTPILLCCLKLLAQLTSFNSFYPYLFSH
jgi:TnpA family transposase